MSELNGFQVSKWYSKRKEEACKLEFSVLIGGIFTTFNLIKLVLCLITFRLLRRNAKSAQVSGDFTYDAPLVTTGDAIVSYLRDADDTTKGICLASKVKFEDGLWLHDC